MSKAKELRRQVVEDLISAIKEASGELEPRWRLGEGSLPANAATGNPYTRGNMFVLWLAGRKLGFKSNLWVTFKQALDLGGHVTKGEKSRTGIFVPIPKKKEGDEDEMFFGSKAVFNVEQCSGLPAHLYDEPEVRPLQERYQDAMVYFAAQDVIVLHRGESAHYERVADRILMPVREDFYTDEHYLATLAHEHVHATGHASRLEREFGKARNDAAYCREELVAELGAALVCAELGVEARVRHADYLKRYLERLEEEENGVMKVLKDAARAAEYMRACAARAEKAPPLAA